MNNKIHGKQHWSSVAQKGGEYSIPDIYSGRVTQGTP
jgi:hypothetical protein